MQRLLAALSTRESHVAERETAAAQRVASAQQAEEPLTPPSPHPHPNRNPHPNPNPKPNPSPNPNPKPNPNPNPNQAEERATEVEAKCAAEVARQQGLAEALGSREAAVAAREAEQVV